MAKYIIKRLLVVIPTLLFIVFVVFFILNITPGDPGRIMLGPTATQEQVDMLKTMNCIYGQGYWFGMESISGMRCMVILGHPIPSMFQLPAF